MRKKKAIQISQAGNGNRMGCMFTSGVSILRVVQTSAHFYDRNIPDYKTLAEWMMMITAEHGFSLQNKLKIPQDGHLNYSLCSSVLSIFCRLFRSGLQGVAVTGGKPRPPSLQSIPRAPPEGRLGIPTPEEKCNLSKAFWVCLPEGHVLTTCPGRCPGDILTTCPNHLNCLISMQSSGSTLNPSSMSEFITRSLMLTLATRFYTRSHSFIP